MSVAVWCFYLLWLGLATSVLAYNVCVRHAVESAITQAAFCSLPSHILLDPMSSQSDHRLRSANASSIQDKLLVGYQGWFQCAGDGPPIHRGHHGWVHWLTHPLNSTAPNRRPNVDFWPDTTGYTDDELYAVPGLNYSDGSSARIWSSRHPRTVHRHFRLMAQYGVDGVFLQRFATHLELGGDRRDNQLDLLSFRDEIGDLVRHAAEAEGRVFAIMYDVTGLKSDRLRETVTVDWAHLVRDKKVLESPNYLKEGGRPVVGLWGVGFAGQDQDPEDIAAIIHFIKDVTPGGAYIMAGTPTYWASLSVDQDPDPRWLELYYDHFDAISPWTVGRFSNERTSEIYAEQIVDDLKSLEINSPNRKIDFIPVVFPGFSSHYLSNGQDPFNRIPRDGGKFLWRQIHNAQRSGSRTVYAAMWDEYDEGTALLPIVSSRRNTPMGPQFLALDIDGYELPSDWYMRIVGLAAEALHDGRIIASDFPKKELDNYWSTRNFHELESSTVEAVNRVFVLARTAPVASRGNTDDPPPPYTPNGDQPVAPAQTSNPFLGLLLSSRSQPQATAVRRESDLQPGMRRPFPLHRPGSPARRDAGDVVPSAGFDYHPIGPALPRHVSASSPEQAPRISQHNQIPGQVQRDSRRQIPFPQEYPRDRDVLAGDPSEQPAVHSGPGESQSSRPQFAFPVPHPDGDTRQYPLTTRDALRRPPLSPPLPPPARRQYHDPGLRPYGPRPPPVTAPPSISYQTSSGLSSRQHRSQSPELTAIDTAWQVFGRVIGLDARQQMERFADSSLKSMAKFGKSRNHL